jgi:hypothetical protein
MNFDNLFYILPSTEFCDSFLYLNDSLTINLATLQVLYLTTTIQNKTIHILNNIY